VCIFYRGQSKTRDTECLFYRGQYKTRDSVSILSWSIQTRNIVFQPAPALTNRTKKSESLSTDLSRIIFKCYTIFITSATVK